jgi:hypothetical protein
LTWWNLSFCSFIGSLLDIYHFLFMWLTWIKFQLLLAFLSNIYLLFHLPIVAFGFKQLYSFLCTWSIMQAVGDQVSRWKVFNSTRDCEERIWAGGKNSRGLNSVQELHTFKLLRFIFTFHYWNTCCVHLFFLLHLPRSNNTEKSNFFFFFLD